MTAPTQLQPELEEIGSPSPQRPQPALIVERNYRRQSSYFPPQPQPLDISFPASSNSTDHHIHQSPSEFSSPSLQDSPALSDVRTSSAVYLNASTSTTSFLPHHNSHFSTKYPTDNPQVTFNELFSSKSPNSVAQIGVSHQSFYRSPAASPDPSSSSRSSFESSSESETSGDSDFEIDEKGKGREGEQRKMRVKVPELNKFALKSSQIYHLAKSKNWFRSETVSGIVSVREEKGIYATYPRPKEDLKAESEEMKRWKKAVSALNADIAVKISSKPVASIMSRLPYSAQSVALDTDTHIQVIESMLQLGSARTHQLAAFVRNEECLVIWCDGNVDAVIQIGVDLHQKMIKYVWSKRHQEFEDVVSNDQNSFPEFIVKFPTTTNSVRFKLGEEMGDEEERLSDLEFDDDYSSGVITPRKSAEWSVACRRKVQLYAPIVTGSAVCLNIVFIGLAMKTLLYESLLDGTYGRWALLITSPFTFMLALFFCICVCGQAWQSLGPVKHCHGNSAYFSGAATDREVLRGRELPHFTVQMPVYKEGLEAVIIPTVTSLKKAITTYERQGGTCSILCCDDGMQLISEEDAAKRREFYDKNNIGWCARPKHGHNGFLRKGRFKKASNMNFSNAVSLRIEEIMDEIRPVPTEDEKYDWNWNEDDEKEIYDEALRLTLEESGGRAWAAGNLRIGEYILIIDSDTEVPEDCLLDAAAELEASPDIAIIQHESAVMYVAGHFFEMMIGNFTFKINKAISFFCANGEVAPFVGHNAFLRWNAVQDASFIDEEDGLRKFWSESHVSEDFDMSLRLQMKGWSLRWATYSNGGFKEGVSLTCDDELNRWQKYAYGCSELLFFPLASWLRKGPVTKLFRTFLFCRIPLHSKISVIAYISSYYAIAIAVGMSTVNWFLVGEWNQSLDAFYLDSWKTFLTCVFVFSFFGNVTFALFMYRLGQADFFEGLLDNFKWIFGFFFFFSGMSYHLTTALVAHLIGYDIQWGATIKEVEASNFFKEVPAVLKRFWVVYLWSFTNILAMAIMASSLVPEGYRIGSVAAILPSAVQAGCHILFPIVLNPWMMRFQF